MLKHNLGCADVRLSQMHIDYSSNKEINKKHPCVGISNDSLRETNFSFQFIMGQVLDSFFLFFSFFCRILRKTDGVAHFKTQQELQLGANGLTFEKNQRVWLSITEPARATFHFT